MKNLFKVMGFPLLLAMALAGCEVEKTEDGEMPDVDVEVEGGNLPKYDVDGPDVDIGTTTKEIEVPTVDVDMPDDDDDMIDEEETP